MIWTGYAKWKTSHFIWSFLLDNYIFLCQWNQTIRLSVLTKLRKKKTQFQGILLNVRLERFKCEHVRSFVPYEYLRQSMTSHSGWWGFKSFHLRVNGDCSWWRKCWVSRRSVTRLVLLPSSSLGYLCVQVRNGQRSLKTSPSAFVQQPRGDLLLKDEANLKDRGSPAVGWVLTKNMYSYQNSI